MTTKIAIEAELPDDDLEIFLTWIRAFDRAHKGCHFKIAAVTGVDESSITPTEVADMLRRLGLTIVFEGRKQ